MASCSRVSITLAQQITDLYSGVLGFSIHFIMASRSRVDASDNFPNFMKSGPPFRIMFYFQEEWHDFPKPVAISLIKAFREGKSPVDFSMEGCNFTADFLYMIMIDNDSKCIQYIAWIDESGKCFFPKFFYDGDTVSDSYNKVENSESSSSDTQESRNVEPLILKQKEVENNSPILPSHGNFGFESVLERLNELEKGGYHYNSVHETFLSGMGSFMKPSNVVAVQEYIPKDHIEKEFSILFQKQIEATNQFLGTSSVRWAWVGTSIELIIKILSGGFLGRQNLHKGKSGGIRFNFSPENCAYVSASDCEVDENGMQHMLLCRIILGNMELNKPGTDQILPSCNNFITGDDDADNPKFYFVWSSWMSHIHPEYVVSFKLSPRVRDTYALLKDRLVSSNGRHVKP